MGLFGKKKGKEKDAVHQQMNNQNSFSELPSLPKLPPLESETEESSLPQLPSFPNNDFGRKFSQNSIKDAVSGKKEGDESLLADDFDDDEDDEQMMQEDSLDSYDKRGFDRKRNFSRRHERDFRSRRQEPVFIRIDKFEESLKLFEKAKEQIDEIEDLIKHTKSLKEKEEEELGNWEEDLQNLKQEIEKIDEDIFSKVE